MQSEECALTRNEYTKERLLKDFYDGIREIQRNSGVSILYCIGIVFGS